MKAAFVYLSKIWVRGQIKQNTWRICPKKKLKISTNKDKVFTRTKKNPLKSWEFTSLETSTTRLSSLLSPSLSCGAKKRTWTFKQCKSRFSEEQTNCTWKHKPLLIKTRRAAHADQYINMTGCRSLPLRVLHVNTPYVLADVSLHEHCFHLALPPSLVFSPWHIVGSLAGHLSSLPLVLLEGKMWHSVTMATMLLMQSWPGIAIEHLITPEPEQDNASNLEPKHQKRWATGGRKWEGRKSKTMQKMKRRGRKTPENK